MHYHYFLSSTPVTRDIFLFLRNVYNRNNHTILMDLSRVPKEAMVFVQSLVNNWEAFALLQQEVHWWKKHKDGDGDDCSGDTFHDKTQLLIDRAVDCFVSEDTLPLGILAKTSEVTRNQEIISDLEDEGWVTNSRFAK